jgi:hypothetical protein
VDHGLHEERHEAQLDAVFLHEVVLVFRAERHDRRHVGLVEGGEHRGLVLGGDEALGDLLAERRELAAGLALARRRGAGAGTGALAGAPTGGPAAAAAGFAGGAGRVFAAGLGEPGPGSATATAAAGAPTLAAATCGAAGAASSRRGGAAAAAASGSIVATSWPIFTSAPAATLRLIRPADSAVPSLVILSVSSSKAAGLF